MTEPSIKLAAAQSRDRPSGAGRIPSLDGLRAASIVAVLFAHASKTGQFPERLLGKLSMLLDGKLGVRVFFVISGFLITTLLLKESEKTGRVSLLAFYQRRALRILPVYFVYILAVAAISCIGLQVIPVANFLSAGLFCTELWGKWDDLRVWPLAHTWSLSIEEQFYLTWPALLAFLGPRFAGRLWIPFLLLLAPILRWIMWPHPIVDHLFLSQSDSIASGCLLALLLARRNTIMYRLFHFRPSLCRASAFCLMYVNILVALVLHRMNLQYPTHMALTVMPSLQCLLIAFLIGSFVTRRGGLGFAMLNWPVVQWVGRLSYSLYIWQQIVLIPLGAPVFPDNWQFVQWLTYFPQNIMVVFLLASLSYYCLEQPLLAMRARFGKVAMG